MMSVVQLRLMRSKLKLQLSLQERRPGSQDDLSIVAESLHLRISHVLIFGLHSVHRKYETICRDFLK